MAAQFRVWILPDIPSRPYYVAAESREEAEVFRKILIEFDGHLRAVGLRTTTHTDSGIEEFDGRTHTWKEAT